MTTELARPEPPASLPPAAAAVWWEIVESNDLAGTVDRAALEAFCTLMATLREARQRVADEGMVVEDRRGRVVPHPALAVERQTAEQIRAWGDRFAPLVKPTRKRGYMADATTVAIANAPHLVGDAGKRYAGGVALAKSLAWLIDEAQRTSMDALQKAAFGTIPTYLKVLAELQLTPASVPASTAPAEGGGGGKLGDFLAAAQRRRDEAAGAAGA